MTEKDYAVSVVNKINLSNNALMRPVYLISFDTNVVGKKKKYFLTSEKPEFEGAFVRAKGVFSELSEEELIEKYNEILSLIDKESILEMYFPNHKILQIRNLVFKSKK